MRSEAYNEDCKLTMSRYPDKYFDLAIVDPPYGINAPIMQMGQNLTRKKNGYPAESTAARLKKGRLNQGMGKLKNRLMNRSIIEWDSEVPSPEYFEELFRVSKNQIIFGGNYFNLPPSRCIICWDKVQQWENFSQWEMAWTSFDRPAKMYRVSNTGGANLDTKIHPTQKPISLYKKILKDFALPGWVILDTHMGSQTLRIACFQSANHFIGSEINTQYYSEGNKFFELKIHQLITMTNGVSVKQGQLF